MLHQVVQLKLIDLKRLGSNLLLPSINLQKLSTVKRLVLSVPILICESDMSFMLGNIIVLNSVPLKYHQSYKKSIVLNILKIS